MSGEELRALAEAATPEWEAWWTLENGQYEVYVPNGTMSTETVLRFCDHLDCEECVRPSEGDAAFIAAANPTAVLALLDERDALRAQVERVRALYGGEPPPIWIKGTKIVRATVDRRRDLGAMVTESLLRVDDVRAALDGSTEGPAA